MSKKKRGAAVVVRLGKRRPRCWIKIQRIDSSTSGGFVKKRFLVDTGATRSSLIDSDVHDVLKLKDRGAVVVCNASGKSSRGTVKVLVCSLRPDGTGTVTSRVQLTCSIRPSGTLHHSVLGIDWISAVRPRFVYTKPAAGTVDTGGLDPLKSKNVFEEKNK